MSGLEANLYDLYNYIPHDPNLTSASRLTSTTKFRAKLQKRYKKKFGFEFFFHFFLWSGLETNLTYSKCNYSNFRKSPNFCNTISTSAIYSNFGIILSLFSIFYIKDLRYFQNMQSNSYY